MSSAAPLTVVSATAADRLTDAAHAERFAEAHADRLRFNHRHDAWYIRRGPLWRPDTDGEIYRLAIDFARTRQLEGVNAPRREDRERETKFALQAESKAALDRLVGLAKNIKPLADAGEHWDSDPWLAGAPNGVLNLRSGELEAGAPSIPITRALGVGFDPQAQCPRFEQFLCEVFRGDVELMAFVQRYAGYALTGCTHEQCLALLYGTGANGKSTFINALAHVFGEYALNLPFSAIEMKQRSAIGNDLASLAGRRLATASETSDGARLNEARVKALTGCDPITARFLYSENFTFSPTAKFVLAVNHKPTVHDDSYGFWRRIRLVPFLERFEGHRRDDSLEQQLKDEAPGILTWCVAGCLAWQTDGLGTPAAIQAATEAYQADSDPLAEFLDECCATGEGMTTRAAALQEAYVKWADRQRLSKYDRLSAKDLGRRMSDRFNRRHTREGWVYDGIQVDTGRLW